MGYALVFPDGSRLPLSGRVGITKQDNDLTKDTVQASYSSQIQLPDDVATHVRLAQPQLGTSLSPAPYQGAGCVLEASGVEVLPGARLALDDYTPRTGYTGKLLAGNKQFYDLLVNADGTDKTLRQLDLSAFDHDWTLGAVAAGAGNTRWQQGYCYDLYDRGLGAPPLASMGSSKLYEAGYWPSIYARAVWEAIFAGAGVPWRGPLPAIFDTALLPATQAFGYADLTRAAHQVVAGYSQQQDTQHFEDERDATLPFTQLLPTKRDTALVLGSAARYDVATNSATITVAGYYDLKAEQDVHMYCFNDGLFGTISATISVYVNGKPAGEPDVMRGRGRQSATLTGLAERQLLQVGDVVQGHYNFDRWSDGGLFHNTAPADESWELLSNGQLTVALLADFPPRGRVMLADWLPEMSQKDFVKNFIQAYGLTQTTDPYTGGVSFRRTAVVVEDPRATGVDWSERVDGSEPVKRSWRLGDFARRNFFRWKADDANTAYQQAVFEQTHAGLGWNDDAAKLAAAAFGAGYLDNGPADVSLAATKDMLTLGFAASQVGADGLLLVPRWKPKAGSDYADDLQVIAEAVADGTYSAEEGQAARVTALGDDYDTQDVQPRLCYQLPDVMRLVLLEDDQGAQQTVAMRQSYFVLASQAEDFDFTRSLLPLYYPHLAAALARPLVLRPSVRLSAAELVAFDQLVPVWLDVEQSFFYCNKVDGWEDGEPSTPVELVRL